MTPIRTQYGILVQILLDPVSSTEDEAAVLCVVVRDSKFWLYSLDELEFVGWCDD